MSIVVNISSENIDINNLTFVDGLNLEEVKIKYYWILNAKIKNAVIGQDSTGVIFYSGYFEGVWVSGKFYSGELVGKFLSGDFYSLIYDVNTLDYDNNYVLMSSDKNNSVFKGYWTDGVFHNGIMNDSIVDKISFITGDINNTTVNNGIISYSITNDSNFIDSIIYDGIYENVNLSSTTFNGGLLKTGSVYNSIIDNVNNISEIGLHDYCVDSTLLYITNTTIKNGNFYSGVKTTCNHKMSVLDNVEIYNCNFYSGTIVYCNWYNGLFYDGIFGNIISTVNNVDLNNIVVNNKLNISNGGYIVDDDSEIIIDDDNINKLSIIKDRVDYDDFRLTNFKYGVVSKYYNMSSIESNVIDIEIEYFENYKYYIDTKIELFIYLSNSITQDSIFEITPNFVVDITEKTQYENFNNIITYNILDKNYKYIFIGIKMYGIGFYRNNDILYGNLSNIKLYDNSTFGKRFIINNGYNTFSNQTSNINNYNSINFNTLYVNNSLPLGDFNKYLQVVIPFYFEIDTKTSIIQFDIEHDILSQYNDVFKVYEKYFEITNIYLQNIATNVVSCSYKIVYGSNKSTVYLIADTPISKNNKLYINLKTRINIKQQFKISNIKGISYVNKVIKSNFYNGYFYNGTLINTNFINGFFENGITKDVVFENMKYNIEEYTILGEATLTD